MIIEDDRLEVPAIVYQERNRLRSHGAVFRGSFRGLKVAVKIIPEAAALRTAPLNKSQLRRISHPNIVKVLHVDHYDGFRCVAVAVVDAVVDAVVVAVVVKLLLLLLLLLLNCCCWRCCCCLVPCCHVARSLYRVVVR